MSDLQFGLAVAGGLVLAAMVGHGAWTSHRNRPRQAVVLESGDESVAAPQAGAGIEPELDAAAF